MKSFEEEYLEQMADLYIVQTIDCSQDENHEIVSILKKGDELPFGYKRTTPDSNTFYRISQCNYTIEQLEKLMFAQQAKHIRTIKNCVVFFVSLLVIFFILSIFTGISMLAY
jgi:flagellar biosynthesis/type III secretory pathway M-ring protein FliF/YscJ